MEKIIATKKGIYIKKLENFGGIIFSPYSGLFFAIAEDYINEVIAYCNNEKVSLPVEIINHIDIGIEQKKKKTFDIKHWLPQKESFSYAKGYPATPIVINWLMSYRCNFHCQYCYAGDVIDKEFETIAVKDIAKKILDLNPLSIVISGGEPLMEIDKIKDVLSEIGGKVGIMLDTNGYLYDAKLTKLLKKHNIVVRISLDTLLISDNKKVRQMRNKKLDDSSLNTIINNILKYRQENIPVLIHTVVTPINKNSLDDLYSKLPLLGVNGWRIFSVVNPNDKELQNSFKKIMNYGNRKKVSIKETQEEIQHKMSIFKSKCPSKSTFSVQIVHSDDKGKNSVILVLPDGRFVTENLLANEKYTINSNNVFEDINSWEHYNRYLGTK
ncbi:MAG: radical SAM protein [Dysgonomonas sp.]|nr:radical SAM protein [Dysgonomonas sp.]